MRVLHLFAGTNSTAQAFLDRGHEVVSVDLEPRFGCTITGDILGMTAADFPGEWDLVLAGVPCEGMGVPQMGKNWLEPGVPRPGTKGELGYRLLRHTLHLIRELRPRAFIIENPRAMMRKLPEIAPLDMRTVTYCQYGFHYQKPTDLFGRFPPGLRLHPACGPGDACHEAAPRGSSGGVQGLANSEVRAEVPYALSMAFCMAMENWPHGTLAGRQMVLAAHPLEVPTRAE